MSNLHVMRAALAVGCAALAGAAAGRDVPVYRECTVPIAFYDEQGERASFVAVAPDLAALRTVKDAQAQAALLGKEAVVELDFVRGGSAFGAAAPVPGKLIPFGAENESRRSQSSQADRNWLAKSLALPSLGQTETNTALAALATDGGDESGWGWLADEVTDAPEEKGRLPNDVLADAQEVNPLEAQEKALAAAANPFPGNSAAARQKTEAPKNDAGAFPANVSDRDLPSRTADAVEMPRRDWTEVGRGAEGAARDYRAPAAAGELTQTRKIIADFSAAARPDFAALRDSLLGASGAAPAGVPPAKLAAPVRADATLGSGARAAGTADFGFSSGRGAATPWQGGWNPSAGSRRSLAPSEMPAPVATPAATRPGLGSGGYKPAWD